MADTTGAKGEKEGGKETGKETEPGLLPANWRNVVVRTHRVKPGDVVAVEVEGGWVRRKTPVGGRICVLRNGEEVFLPDEPKSKETFVGEKRRG